MEMNAALEQLSKVQQAISARNEPERADGKCQKLLFCLVAGLLHVDFYGVPFEESFEDFMGAKLCILRPASVCDYEAGSKTKRLSQVSFNAYR